MPYTPSRSDLILSLQALTVILVAISVCRYQIHGNDPVPELQLAIEMNELLRTLYTTRYIAPRNRVPMSTDWRLRVLEAYEDKDFVSFMRMTKAQFNTLVDLIKDHSVFIPKGNKPQMPVREQLKICLYRLGAPAMMFNYVRAQNGVSKGHAVHCFWRCIEAIRSLATRFVLWPDVTRRREIKTWYRETFGLPQCIGAIDGIHFPYDYAPHLDPDAWNTYKCRYAMGATAVCDHQKRFTYFRIGDFGSTHDATAFRLTKLYKWSNIFFNGDEYLLADKGYSSLPITVLPFKSNNVTTQGHRTFNSRHKSGRTKIENAFGLLKGKWRSLECMAVDVEKEGDEIAVCSWIVACVVLHNYLLMHPGDRLEEGPRNKFQQTWYQRSSLENPADHNEAEDRRAGKAKRDRIVDLIMRYRPY